MVANYLKTNKMKISISKIWGQVYLLPFIKITHDKFLNGKYEFIIGWLKWEIIFNKYNICDSNH
tara:strand:+ start:831 stop:1022 length:192 start_codon:yes stop_codon:yes gene_type:complete